MARSVFRRADLYIVDDSFSALDMHVGMHVFQEVFGPNGLLKDTTRIIALNSTYFLPFFDSIIYLEGSYQN
jgi:ABC-type multidrug transport system fused ATPase/permease subunit